MDFDGEGANEVRLGTGPNGAVATYPLRFPNPSANGSALKGGASTAAAAGAGVVLSKKRGQSGSKSGDQLSGDERAALEGSERGHPVDKKALKRAQRRWTGPEAPRREEHPEKRGG